MRESERWTLTLIITWLIAASLSPGSGFVGREALAFIGDTEKAAGLNGSLRTLGFLLDQDGVAPFSGQNSFDALCQAILRLTLAGKPTHSLAYEFHWVHSLTLSTANLSGASPLAFGNATVSTATRYRAIDASWSVLEADQALSTASFDRFNAKLALDWGDVTLGRQAITFGKTYFWNPLDVFFPFDATQFDRDYKPGVDALRVDISLGRFSGINLVGAAGPEISIQAGERRTDPADVSWYGSALLGRLFANVGEWDLSLQGGKVYGGLHVGAGAVGDAGPIQVRGEIAQFLAMRSDSLPFPLQGDLFQDHFLAVLGLGRRFENSLSLDFEYFYNGAGDPDDLNAAFVRTRIGSSLQMSRHMVGLVARYEISPLLNGQLAALTSLSDGSTQLQPILTISLSDEMDLLLGMMLNFGRPPAADANGSFHIRSELGSTPTVGFMEWKVYF